MRSSHHHRRAYRFHAARAASAHEPVNVYAEVSANSSGTMTAAFGPAAMPATTHATVCTRYVVRSPRV